MAIDQCLPCDDPCLAYAYNKEDSFRKAVLAVLCQIAAGGGEGGGGEVTGTVTANAGTNLNTSLLALESGGNLAALATALGVIDDWDETDRAKVNLIAGQAGVQGASGAVSANTQRVVLATDVPLPTGTNSVGQVTANAGTNLNTALLALEAGNLATLAGAVAATRVKVAASTSWTYTPLTDAVITVASLATSAALTVGRQSSVVATAGYEDVLVAGKLTVGTTPTINTRMEVWAVGSVDGTIWPDGVAETDAAKTFTTAGIKYLSGRQVAFLDVLATTSDVTFPIPLFSLKTIFEGFLPQEVVFFVVHNTAVNLNSTAGNHAINLTGVRKVLGA